jgi:hypothetical protein
MQCITRMACAALVVIAPALSACDALDTFELFDTKKKLQGERKPVFPDGIPGVTAGVPPDLVKGYKEPEGQAESDPVKAAAETAAQSQAPAPAKPKPKPQQTASRPPLRPAADPNAPRQPTTPAASAPAATASAPAATPAAAPLPGATLPWPAATPQAAWPAAPPSGTLAQ